MPEDYEVKIVLLMEIVSSEMEWLKPVLNMNNCNNAATSE